MKGEGVKYYVRTNTVFISLEQIFLKYLPGQCIIEQPSSPLACNRLKGERRLLLAGLGVFLPVPLSPPLPAGFYSSNGQLLPLV